MNQLHKQKGLTFLGFIIVAALICFFVLVGLRLFPLYNEKFAVDQSLASVANQPDIASKSEREIRKYFMRNVDINDIDRFTESNIDEYLSANKIGKRPREMYMKYEARNDLFGNLDIVLSYDKTVVLD